LTENKDNSKTLFPRRVFAVSDFEFSNGTLKFFNTQGLIRRKIVLVRAIPVSEISSVESYWNELSITWNNVTNIFFKKNSYESFTDLRDQIRVMLEEYRIALQQKESVANKEKEIIAIIKSILPVVDMCFNFLMGLHDTKIDWKHAAESCNGIGQNLQLTSRTLPTLTLDFVKISTAVAIQSQQEMANESLNLLKSIYHYFICLAQDDEIANIHPNWVNPIIDSYYTLNDIFLGKIVGDKENLAGNNFLIDTLTNIDMKGFKINMEELKVRIDRFDVEADKQSAVKNARDLFKSQLS
jgi:hypothetical protein